MKAVVVLRWSRYLVPVPNVRVTHMTVALVDKLHGVHQVCILELARLPSGLLRVTVRVLHFPWATELSFCELGLKLVVAQFLFVGLAGLCDILAVLRFPFEVQIFVR